MPVNPKGGTIFGYESVTRAMGSCPARPSGSPPWSDAGVPMFNDVEEMAEAAGLLARYPALRDSARGNSFSSVTIRTRHHP